MATVASRTARKEELQRIVRAGDAERAAGRWSAALENYNQALPALRRMPELHLHMAICQLALSRFEDALEESTLAVRLKPSLWQAHVVRIKALRRLGRGAEAAGALRAVPAVEEPLLERERIALTLHELGDAAAATRLARTARTVFRDLPQDAAGDLELDELIGRLYDPGNESAPALADAFKDYSRRRFGPAAPPPPARPSGRRRRRVGVMSPQLHASPVYFFGFGALRLLARSVDLVFFHRGVRMDWATQSLRGIAADWVDVAALDAAALERALRERALDALIDMGGWMDCPALRALAAKPAARMYKWVGGQSLTTGLRSFDGFISEHWQSPLDAQPLYTEPLVNLDCGYVTYAEPPYMPARRAADPGPVLGVISNPVKVSRAFLQFVAGLGVAPELRFIDKRYRHPELRQRILSALPAQAQAGRIQFRAPEDHAGYLGEVSRLAAVIDTFPYSGGLTTMEAMSLGVPCYTRPGQLFCERHTWAHCKQAGMEEAAFALRQGLEVPASVGVRASLVAGSPRLDHAALAAALLRLIES